MNVTAMTVKRATKQNVHKSTLLVHKKNQERKARAIISLAIKIAIRIHKKALKELEKY